MTLIEEINSLINFVNYQSRIIGMLWERTMPDEPLPSFQTYLEEEERRKMQQMRQEKEVMEMMFPDEP